MKLLIVDDEELTRRGLAASINWDSLNIKDVIQAENGIQGLELAKKEKPDIILSDIRMPRMNGIQMAESLKEILPDSRIIFISGYSDREYLKAAIKLKAISYVEKPINILELEEAISSAIEELEHLRRSKRSEEAQDLAKSSKLALYMTYPPHQRKFLSDEELAEYPLLTKPTIFITTFINKFISSIDEIDPKCIKKFNLELSEFLKYDHLFEVHVTKYDQYFVYHLISSSKPSSRTLKRTGEFMQEKLNEISPFFIAIGDTVTGIENAYKSYASAVVLLQSSFFYDYNSILFPQQTDFEYNPILSISVSAYIEALISKNLERIKSIEQKIFNVFNHNHTLLPNQVKDFYYKLFMAVQDTYKQLQIPNCSEFSSSESILEYLQNCHTLLQLHSLLTEKSYRFYKDLQEQLPQNSTIMAIKNFIGQHYQNENLSVRDISLHVHMSSSYVCTLFKNETGITLNQYISNFRIDRSKQLLADSQYKITDISSKVGYNDGNYFGKSFKKHVGLSPSEYREKMLS